MTIDADKTNDTLEIDDHPEHHNLLAMAVNTLMAGSSSEQYAEDTQSAAGDMGTVALVIRRDAGGTLVDADGDYTTLQVDANGYLRVTGGGGGVQFSEDAPHASGDIGTLSLVVRKDVAGTLAGTDGDYAPLQVDASGYLRVATSAQFAEDSPHASGDQGILGLVVRKDAGGTLSSTDGDYTPLQVDASGNLRVTGGPGATQYAEDAPHVTADLGTMALGVRIDSPGTLESTSGDYAPFQVDSVGALRVTTNTQFAEDAAHVSGHFGTMALVVRKDTPGTMENADGDYAPLQVDANGYLRVTAPTQYAEDVPHVSGDLGTLSLVVRKDAAAALAGTDGDYSPLQVDATGALRVTGGGGGSQYAEDAVHASGDLGTLALVVRKDVAGTLESADGDYAPLQVDANGALRVTGASGSVQYAEDAPAASGDTGTMALAVRKDAAGSLESADGDYSPLQVDANGALRVTMPTPSTQYAEDAAHTSGDLGNLSLVVRKDAAAALAGTDGDYSPLQVDASGALRVTGGGGGVQFAEDAPHTSGDTGTLGLVVRKDAAGTLSSTDGDYTPLQVDASGNLRVTGGGGGTQFAEDAAHTSGDLGTLSLVVRKDAAGSLSSTDGDYTPLQVDASGSLRVTGGTAGTQFAEDAAHTSGDLGTLALGVRKDAAGTLSGTDGDYSVLQLDAFGNLRVVASTVITGITTESINNVGAFALNDAVLPSGGNAFSINPVCRAGFGGQLVSLDVLDKDNQGVDMEIWVFQNANVQTSLPASNAAWVISTAVAAYRVPMGILYTSSWVTLGSTNGKVGMVTFPNGPLPFKPNANGTTLYFGIKTLGTPTYTAGGLVLSAGIVMD